MIQKTAKHGPFCTFFGLSTCTSVSIDCASWSIHNTWQGQCQGHLSRSPRNLFTVACNCSRLVIIIIIISCSAHFFIGL